MDVLFRKDKNTKEVVAFLLECPVNYGNILCYMHIGQHSEASLQYYWDTVKTTEEECKPLLEELENIVYNGDILTVKKRLNYDKLSNAWNYLRRK